MWTRAAPVSLLGVLLALLVWPPALEGAYGFRKPLVVRGARIVGGPHANFPVLVNLVDPNLRAVASGGNVRSASGFDLEFRASDLVTILPHEIESYDPGTGSLAAWVRLPSITNGTDVTIHLYYGDPGITCARNNPGLVWDATWREVFHMSQTAGAPLDSTANAVAATIEVGAVTPGAAGRTGSAYDFAGGRIRLDDGTLNADAAFTMEAWVNFDALPNGQFIGLFTKGRDDPGPVFDWAGIFKRNGGSGQTFGWPCCVAGYPGNLDGSAFGVTATWFHVAAVFDGARRFLYRDGVLLASDLVTDDWNYNAIPEPSSLGNDRSNANFLDGRMDEVRFSNVARTAGWVTTTYQNLSCPSQSVFPAGCAAGTHFVDGSGAQVGAGLPLFSNATAGSGLNTGGAKDGGVAWQDWNGDGCLDLLVNSNDAVVASRLYLQDKSATCTGTFTDVTSCIAAGLLISPLERAVVWGDLNNDGRPDFVRDDNLSLQVYLNNGPGLTTGGSCPAAGVAWSRFGNPLTGTASQTIDGAVIPGYNGEGMGLLDHDVDGDLDLVVDDATGGIRMLRNNGAGVLTNVAGTGLPAASAGNGDYLVVGDFDVDGDVDIFARREDGATVWVNNGGTFSLNLNSPEVAVNGNKGGVAMCDLDNDGDLDFVWTDGLNGIVGSAGAEAWRNNGEGGTAATWTNFPLTFVPAPAGGEIVDGVSCGDVDHDGDLDLAFTNGGNDYLFRNDGAFAFTNITPGAFGSTDGEGNAFGDYDRDGDLDLVVNQAAANERWRNETGGNNYLMVRALHDVDGAGPGTTTRDALGATVSLRSCSGTLVAGVRQVDGGGGMGSQGPPLVHFGLPTAGSPQGPNMVYVVRVQYVGGTVRQKAVVPAALGCYQEVAITDTAADDTAACLATAVELSSFEARGCEAGVDLRWTTASETSNLGFHLHRAPDPEGPYTRLTPTLIPGLGSSPTGASYDYLDGSLAPGSAYSYKLEDVDTGGVSTFHGPVSATPEPGVTCASGPNGKGTGGEAGPGGGDESEPEETTARRRHGDPGAPRLRELERSARHVVLELVTPGFDAVVDGEGQVRLELPGFELPSEADAVALPRRRALVPAVAGRQVRLTVVEASGSLLFEDLDLGAVGRPTVEVGASGVVRAGRRGTGRSRPEESVPSDRDAAALRGSLFQGEIKKAEIELRPLRYDAARKRVVLHRRLVVRLDFRGVARGERALGAARGRKAPPVARANAQGVIAHLVTREEGVYRVTFEEVYGASRRGVSVRGLRLSRLGEAVPFRVEPEAALFGPGSKLYFLGGGDSNPWGEQTYELGYGTPGLLMEELDGRPSGAAVAEILAERTFEQNRFYQAALLEAPDLWLWDLVVSPGTKSFAFGLDQVATTSWRAGRIAVTVQGASDFDAPIDHHVRILVNGLSVAEERWAGKTERVLEGEIPAGLLREGENTLSLENVADTGAAYSMVFLSRFRVTWPRRLAATSGELVGLADESGTAEVAGLAGDAIVLDTTGAPAFVRGGVATPGGLSVRVESNRRYRLVDGGGLRTPTVRRPPAPALRARSNRADWVLVAPRELLPAARPLVEQRRRQGLRPKAVALEDVYAEFGHGEPGPAAIRAFLAYAWESWKRPSPRYVVLLGDSSYDPKDHLGTGVRDWIPSYLVRTTFLWAPSDPSLAAVNGDDLVPDLAVGRLPASNVAEAQRLVEKILAFERGGFDLSGTAVLVADNPDASGHFEADAEEIASGVLAGRPVERVFHRELGAATRDTIRAALDAGPALVSYMGHGGTAVWASENVWNNLDVPSLAPQARPHLLLALNCLNGFFHFPSLDSLGEAFVKAEGRGAVAAFAPSGLSINAAAHAYHRALLAEIESGRHRRLGDALLAAQGVYADGGALPELLAIYHLFGDPALPIQ